MENKVRVKEDFSTWDLDGLNITQIIEKLIEVKKGFESKGLAEPIFDRDISSYYGSIDDECNFYSFRPETTMERNLRIKNERGLISKKEHNERVKYEELKKKFGNR